MELPPYRLPTLKGLLIHTWERTWQYIKKAGTVIVAISIVFWAMMTFPGLPEQKAQEFETQRELIRGEYSNQINIEVKTSNESTKLSPKAKSLHEKLMVIDGKEAGLALKNSLAGQIGTALESVSQFAGFDWRTNIALVGGFAAKEVIVATLGTAYSLGDVDPEASDSLAATLAKSPGWSPLVGLALIIFTMFYSPCFVTVVCIAKETGTWKWGAFSILFSTAAAAFLAISIYQIGTFLGLG